MNDSLESKPCMKMLSQKQEEMLLAPKPGTAAARARDFGIDLTLTVANLRLTPQQRLERLEAKREFVRKLRDAVRASQGKPMKELEPQIILELEAIHEGQHSET